MRLSKKPPTLGNLFGDETSSSYGSDSEDQSSRRSSLQLDEKTVSSVIQDSRFFIKYEDLKIDDNTLLGAGAFGNVWKGTLHGTDVAVKEMLLLEDEHMQKLILREIEMLK